MATNVPEHAAIRKSYIAAMRRMSKQASAIGLPMTGEMFDIIGSALERELEGYLYNVMMQVKLLIAKVERDTTERVIRNRGRAGGSTAGGEPGPGAHVLGPGGQRQFRLKKARVARRRP